MKVFPSLMIIIFSAVCGESAKILGVFPSNGYSQFILAEKLMSELAKRGHNVTVVSHFEPKTKIENYRTILTDGPTGTEKDSLLDWANLGIFRAITTFHNFCYMLTEHILSHKKVQDLLLSNETFDLVIVEQFGNEAHMGFASHFSAPLVTFSSISLSEWNSHLVGNIKLPSIVPFSLSSHSNHMNFIQRVTNTMAHIFDAMYKELIYFPWQQSMLDKYFPQKMDLKTIMFNTSFMLLNSHSISTEPVQLTSSVAEIGGFHITPNELPKSVQEFLDGAENGVILFSLGSNLRSSDLPRGTLDMILEVFRRIPQRIIWKFEETDIHHKPDNVMISKWMQQSDILAHPNTRAFITHGGILSTTEAIHYGVPMIGIPILGDQYMNVARMVRKRLCINLPLPELTENSFHEAIREVIENPEYRNNAQKYSKIFRDRLNKPLDEAVFWIEYVLRHNGATHLRNASMDLYWFQLYTLDVWLFIFSWPILFYLFGRA